MRPLNIVVLGRGNVATHLSEVLLNAGYSVLQNWRRGEKLKDADLYLIAVSDDAIEEVANLIPADKFFAHTSGSIDLSGGGVFYPLQTFSKNAEIDWHNIPILIEANEKKLEILLFEIAQKISANVHLINAQKRHLIHLCAVFANNFTNHLWSISEDLLNQNDLSFELLKPLIQQTFHKIKNHHPRDVQTGPAIRNDLKTLGKHRKLLSEIARQVHSEFTATNSENPLTERDFALLDLYNMLSKSIQNGSYR